MSEIDDFADKYIGIVDKIIAKIPYKRLTVWKEFFLNPVATVKNDQLTIGQRMKDIIVSGLIGAVIGLVAMIPLLLISALTTAGASLIVMAAIPVLMVVGILLAPILIFIYSLLELIVAKVVGGKGSVRANFNASALPNLGVTVITLPLTLVSVPVAWLSAIPFVNICMMIVNIPLAIVSSLVGIYGLYLKYLAMKEVHTLSTWRAVAVVLIPPIVIIGLVAVVVIALYAFLIAALVGLGSGMQIAN